MPYVLDRDRVGRPGMSALSPYRSRRDNAVEEWEARDQRRESVRAYRRFQDRLRCRLADEPTVKRQVRLADKLLGRDRDCSRLAAYFDHNEVAPFMLLTDFSASTFAGIALDSAYVAGVSGDAIAMRYVAPVGGKTLSTVYFRVTSYTGTAANVNDLNLEIRAEASAGSVLPNTAATVATATKDPVSATGWITSTGWSAALSAMTRYFVIIGDADGNGTDFATLLLRSTSFPNYGSSNSTLHQSPTSTINGWSSGGNLLLSAATIVLVFSDGTTMGFPFSAFTAPASDTYRRGLRIAAGGLIANLPVFGMQWAAANANISGMEIYDNANAPGTSPANTSTDLICGAAAIKAGCYTNGGAPVTLAVGTDYRIVATFSGATTAGPQRVDIGTGEDATLRSAMPGGGNFYYTRANDTTDWSNDLVGSLPAAGLMVDGQVAAAGGMLRHCGMDGGCAA